MNDERKDRLEKLKQKTAIINLFKDIKTADLIEIKDMTVGEGKRINDFLKDSYTDPCLYSTDTYTGLERWIEEKFRLNKISDHILIHVRSNKWMAEVKVKDWQGFIKFMMKYYGLCFYDYETGIGINADFNEDICFIDVKRNHTNEI